MRIWDAQLPIRHVESPIKAFELLIQPVEMAINSVKMTFSSGQVSHFISMAGNPLPANPGGTAVC